MAVFAIRHRFTGKILHSVEIGDRHVELYAPDLRGLDLVNLILNGADLACANLARANLRGTKLREADLCRANLQNADASYCDFTSADLREANLDGTIMFPSEILDAKFYGAIITPQTDVILPIRVTPHGAITERILQRHNMRQYVTEGGIRG
jgi:uncharacterized protein YjbI with pentapeptide repeats